MAYERWENIFCPTTNCKCMCARDRFSCLDMSGPSLLLQTLDPSNRAHWGGKKSAASKYTPSHPQRRLHASEHSDDMNSSERNSHEQHNIVAVPTNEWWIILSTVLYPTSAPWSQITRIFCLSQPTTPLHTHSCLSSLSSPSMSCTPPTPTMYSISLSLTHVNNSHPSPPPKFQASSPSTPPPVTPKPTI